MALRNNLFLFFYIFEIKKNRLFLKAMTLLSRQGHNHPIIFENREINYHPMSEYTLLHYLRERSCLIKYLIVIFGWIVALTSFALLFGSPTICIIGQICGLVITILSEYIHRRIILLAKYIDEIIHLPALLTHIHSRGIVHRVAYHRLCFPLDKPSTSKYLYLVFAPEPISHACDIQLRSDSSELVLIDPRRYSQQCIKYSSNVCIGLCQRGVPLPVYMMMQFQPTTVYVQPGVGWSYYIQTVQPCFGINYSRFAKLFRSCWFNDYNRNRAVFAARGPFWPPCTWGRQQWSNEQNSMRWSLFHRRVILGDYPQVHI